MNIIILNTLTSSGADTLNEYEINNPKQVAHIKKILKPNIGDTIRVGELNGWLGNAKVSEIGQDYVKLQDINLVQKPPKKIPVTIILALPRPKVLRRLIMDMTAFGVARIILINSFKTEKSYWQSPMLKRINEFVIEGLQQGVDTVAPEIIFKKRFKPFVEDELLNLTKPGESEIKGIVAHPYAPNSWNSIKYDFVDTKSMNTQIGKGSQKEKIICIGAEGGWIDYEINLLQQNGIYPVNFGKRILRTEAFINAILGNWLQGL